MPDECHRPALAQVAAVILFAMCLPAGSALQEVVVTPLCETSWP